MHDRNQIKPMRVWTLIIVLGVALGTRGIPPALGADVFKPEKAAVEKVAALLSPKPLAMGPSVTNRVAWLSAAARPDLRDVRPRAEEELGAPLADLPDDLYLEYSETGNRQRCESVLFGRRQRVRLFTLAECLQNRGRFVPALEEAIRAIGRERTWVMPAHDGALDNFHGRAVTVDLAVAMFAWDLATTDSLLGEKLSPAVRELIRLELDRRVFAPYRRMAAGEQDQAWLVSDNNWNAVCLAGVTGAALTILTNANERALFVLAAEKYSRNFLNGFTPDGYCSEGVGYWNYGFGHYLALAEAVRRATRGGVDLLARKEAVRPAAYGFQIEVSGGVCPAFADCAVGEYPDPHLLAYLSRRFGFAAPAEAIRVTARTYLYWTAMDLLPDAGPVIAPEVVLPKPGALRTWFPDAGVLICRPGTNRQNRLGVAILGGHNAEHHNHNDVGTFMVVVGREAVLPDIGAEVYTQRTFSARRYDSQALNSYGHAVPVVAGRLQRTGRDAAARVLRTDFQEGQDTLLFDIRAAYDVPTLLKLNRTYVYARRGQGSLTVTDSFAFSEPARFETALLTIGDWQQLGPAILRVTDGGESVRVEVKTPNGAALEMAAEEIREDLASQRRATRIGLRLKRALAEGELTVHIGPEPGR